MNTNLILTLAQQKKIDIDLSLRMITKATKLLKKIAISLEMKPEELTGLFNTDGAAFFGKLNSFLTDCYDDELDAYTGLGKDFLLLIKQITKSSEDIENLQILEIFAKINDITSSLSSEGQENFLKQSDTISENITEPLGTTESVT